MSTQVILNTGAAPRGQGPQGTQSIGIQSIRGSFAWGGSPGTMTLVFVNDNQSSLTGALLQMNVDNHYFVGICKSDTTNVSSHGAVREIQFVDLREFLAWDYVYCIFNMPIRRYVDGVWTKQYWHVYPEDFNTFTRTYTNEPLLAWQIVEELLQAPTVGSPWSWDLTGAGLFPGGLMNQPVYSFDCRNGVRLDSALNDISSRGGLVYTHAPTSIKNYHLVWMRKGYGLIPVLSPFTWPANSDEQRIGLSLTENATDIRVIGERNQYQILNMPLAPDWNSAWEQFLSVDLLTMDIFQNEANPVTGVAYNSYSGDPENWIGGADAAARAHTVTVAEYVAMRNARSGDGNQFADYKRFEGRLRMDMPAALYIEKLVYRAYVPNPPSGIVNVAGNSIDLDSVDILDSMLCRVTYDPATGAMAADTSTLADGNGVGIVQAVSFGQDLFNLVNPERINSTFFTITNRPWTAVSFQIDDGGGPGQRFIIFDQPCFTSENLLVQVNGYWVLNANPTLNEASAQAALTFEMEPYSYSAGVSGRNRAEYVGGLNAEYVGKAGDYGEGYEQIPFANGQTADQQTSIIASNLLLCQYIYASGGYKYIQTATNPLGTPLSSIIDRVEIELNPNGFFEIVDFTSERERAHFEPERDLERRTVQNSLFSGQTQLQDTARDYQRFAQGIKGMTREQMQTFIHFMNGQFDDNMAPVKFNGSDTVTIPNGDTLAVGTPVFGPAPDVSTLATYPPNFTPGTDTQFYGVTVRNGEYSNPAKPFYVKTTGQTYCRVQGPITAGTSIGPNTGGSDYSTNGAYLISGGSLGIAMQDIADTSIQLIKVNLGTGGSGGGGDPVWLP